jgi:D-alanyl-lipoteichoic acid acyltransferase DltB (MBOAT superfamily)
MVSSFSSPFQMKRKETKQKKKKCTCVQLVDVLINDLIVMIFFCLSSSLFVRLKTKQTNNKLSPKGKNHARKMASMDEALKQLLQENSDFLLQESGKVWILHKKENKKQKRKI